MGRFLLLLLASSVVVDAATLKGETILAWEDYLRWANETLQQRLRPDGKYLWTFEDADRLAKVRAGEIVVAPVSGRIPINVPGGLIHHWVGGAFLPNATLDNIQAVTRDYDRYKDFYQPSVVQSNLLSRNDGTDTSRMVLLNRAYFMRTALDADYEIRSIRVDERRVYSISKTTRLQEIEGFGQESEHRLPEGQGDGFAWRLYTISRLEQRDGGVYMETEALELSRGIPFGLRFLVEPIVRNVSRKLLFVSISQTREAVARSVKNAVAP